MPTSDKANFTHIGVLDAPSQNDEDIRKSEKIREKEEVKVKNICPECGNQVYFLEAGFLCPTCGYSVETIFS